MDDDVEQYEAVFCVRGYHVYKDVWRAAVGEDLECERETSNAHDRYAVAVTKESHVISILISAPMGHRDLRRWLLRLKMTTEGC